MDAPYHRSITTQALGEWFSARALQVIIAANLSLDGLVGQLLHPEYHFDDNAFAAGEAFVQARRAEVRPWLEAGEREKAWRAFGKVTHAVQDFYAHTNYVALWLGQPDKKRIRPRLRLIRSARRFCPVPNLSLAVCIIPGNC